VDDKKQLSTFFDFGYLGKYWYKEVVYKDGLEVEIQQYEN